MDKDSAYFVLFHLHLDPIFTFLEDACLASYEWINIFYDSMGLPQLCPLLVSESEPIVYSQRLRLIPNRIKRSHFQSTLRHLTFQKVHWHCQLPSH